jgi:uncharacterized protein
MTGTLASIARAAMLALSLLFVSTLPALADPQFPALTGRVVDDAHVLPAETQAALTQKLADLEAKTGDQMVVATVPSLQGYDIDTYGYQLGRKWNLGQKGKNNGVLFLIAPKEHKARFDVGYGLEGTLTDIFTGAVLDEKVFPRFKAGDLPGGVTAGTDAVLNQLSPGITGVSGATEAANPPIVIRRHHHSSGLPIGAIIAMIVVFLVLSRVLRFGFFWPLMFLGMGRGGGWSGGGGGWGGGGGGGGFSGGGGSFGGGGSSGSW